MDKRPQKRQKVANANTLYRHNSKYIR